MSSNPTGLDLGYELGYFRDFGNALPLADSYMISVLYPPNSIEWIYFLNTSILANPTQLTCCGNGTGQTPTPAAVRYWSGNFPLIIPCADEPWPINFTVKWIYGHALPGYKKAAIEGDDEPHLIFSKVPSIQALNCLPIIETATVNVKVQQNT